MYLVYNCGYYLNLSLVGKVSRKMFSFKKRFVTEVNEKDGEEFLKMTHKNIAWCPTTDKNIPPFMKLEDWCAGKEGRFDLKPIKVYNSDEYKSLFLLK